MWERKLEHDDFLDLRLGRGNKKPEVEIKTQEERFSIEQANRFLQVVLLTYLWGSNYHEVYYNQVKFARIHLQPSARLLLFGNRSSGNLEFRVKRLSVKLDRSYQ